jgi:ABC-type sugar transport system ATPase subunit
MVFQSALLYPHLNCEQNILMSLHKANIDSSEKNIRVNEASEMLNISNLLNKKPHELSGGERQRVATAKAIVRQPDVFLLDEPMAALDAALRQTLRSELVNLQKKLNTTTIYVTHDQVEAMTMGDRIAVMNQGKVEQIGTPIEIYKNPQSKFVAGFIGSPPMNFIEGKIIEENNKSFFESKYLKRKIELNNSLNKPNAKHLSFRPQNIYLTKDQDYDLELKVFGIENLGKEIIIICDDGENKIRVITETFLSQINDLVRLKIDRENILLF